MKQITFLFAVIFTAASVTHAQAKYDDFFFDKTLRIDYHHIGDANLRGYVGSHRRGRNALALNSEYVLPQFSLFRVFVDVGSVWDAGPAKFLWDAGVGIDLSLFRFDFPVCERSVARKATV